MFFLIQANSEFILKDLIFLPISFNKVKRKLKKFLTLIILQLHWILKDFYSKEMFQFFLILMEIKNLVSPFNLRIISFNLEDNSLINFTSFYILNQNNCIIVAVLRFFPYCCNNKLILFCLSLAC